MAVIRIQKTNNYTVMSNYHFREKDMSLKAKGLLSLMLSLPEDWDYSVDGLVKRSKDGKDGVISAIMELEQFGYLVRSQAKGQDGKFAGYDYDVYEQPYTEKPFTENPSTVKPMTENPQQLNTKPLNTESDKINTNKEEEKERTIDDVISEQFEKLKIPLRNYVKMRKAIKKPLTTYGLELAIKKLQNLSDDINEQIEIINQSVMNSWQGLFPLKDGDKPKPTEELIKGKYTRAQVEDFARQLNISYEKALECC